MTGPATASRDTALPRAYYCAMSEDSPRERWRGIAQDCARSLARTEGAVSFLLGAGASLTSGAPSTSKVLSALADATSGRLKADAVRDLVHRIGERDKQNVLRGLFEDISPYVGYMSLAALGKHRRVVVVNLNWDPLISMACERLGVPHQALDLADKAQWRGVNRLPEDKGIVVIHAHGMLGTRSGIATLETLSFTLQEEQFLGRLAWANPTVIVGASLVHDTDLEAMFRRLGTKSDSGVARWLFARQDGNRPVLPPASEAAGQLFRWPLNCVASDDVDFDLLLVTILAEQVGFTYEDLRAMRPTANLPEMGQLILPKSDLTRDHLNSRIIVLSGEPKLGKTTLAYLLGWWRTLWGHAPEAGDAPAPRALGGYEDTATTLAALATQGDDPTAGAATAGKKVLVLDDPYGQASSDANPSFLPQLRRVAALPDCPAVVVATREIGWHSALRQENLTTRDLSSESIAVVSPDVGSWWSVASLVGLTDLLPHAEELKDAVESGRLNTPGRLLERAWIRSIRRGARHNETTDSEVALSKGALLALVPDLARGCAIARLQEFCSEPLTKNEFEEVLGAEVADVPGLQQMLISYLFEGKPRLRLAHPTYREAVDSYLSDGERLQDITDWLRTRPVASRLLRNAADAYRLVDSAITDPDGWANSKKPNDASEWAAQILAVCQSEHTINALRRMKRDLWTATELAYELVRLYPAIRSKGGREFLREMLTDEQSTGAYAVLEACLYLRSSAGDEVWSALKARLYELTAPSPGEDAARSARSRELALAIDGLLWRPPPFEAFSEQLVRSVFEEVSEKEPMWGIVRFAAAYHPGGLAALGVKELVEADHDLTLTDEQVEFVAWLIQWHFVHQSRARAILARQPYVDQAFLCRSLHPSPVEGEPRALRRLMMNLMSVPSTAGWVMHLGCNLMSIGVTVDESCQALMRDSMSIVGSADLGVITSALTYSASAKFADVLRPYFAGPENREAFLDAISAGPVVVGTRIRPPRFVCGRPPRVIQEDLGLTWPRLHQAGFDASDPEKVAGILRSRAEILASRGIVDGETVEVLIDRVRRGDMRVLEEAVSAREAPNDLVDHLLQIGCFAIAEGGHLSWGG
jgi:hypothetical protein